MPWPDALPHCTLGWPPILPSSLACGSPVLPSHLQSPFHFCFRFSFRDMSSMSGICISYTCTCSPCYLCFSFFFNAPLRFSHTFSVMFFSMFLILPFAIFIFIFLDLLSLCATPSASPVCQGPSPPFSSVQQFITMADRRGLRADPRRISLLRLKYTRGNGSCGSCLSLGRLSGAPFVSLAPARAPLSELRLIELTVETVRLPLHSSSDCGKTDVTRQLFSLQEPSCSSLGVTPWPAQCFMDLCYPEHRCHPLQEIWCGWISLILF